jgi:hypothetical protein
LLDSMRPSFFLRSTHPRGFLPRFPCTIRMFWNNEYRQWHWMEYMHMKKHMDDLGYQFQDSSSISSGKVPLWNRRLITRSNIRGWTWNGHVQCCKLNDAYYRRLTGYITDMCNSIENKTMSEWIQCLQSCQNSASIGQAVSFSI